MGFGKKKVNIYIHGIIVLEENKLVSFTDRNWLKCRKTSSIREKSTQKTIWPSTAIKQQEQQQQMKINTKTNNNMRLRLQVEDYHHLHIWAVNGECDEDIQLRNG